MADAGRPRRGKPAEEQRRAYLEGHRKNPLTTTDTGGRILSASQLPWFTILPPHGFGVLTTVGRKTGKRRRKCVRAIREGDRAYLVSLKGSRGAWFRNLEVEPEVRLRIRGGFFRGRAREITDPEELAHAKAVYSGRVNRLDWIEYRMHRPDRPTEAKIRALHEKWFDDGTPVVIELAP
jgi:deazaflavin-dependent oxidoreductase (nitroreductase family)